MEEMKGQKNLAIEGLRGIAIVSVLLFHISLSLEYFGVAPGSGIQTIFSFGKFGVHLFFCISGFVIALSLKRHVSALSFLRARVFRLWPSLVIFHFCMLLLWIINVGPASFQSLNFSDFMLSIFLLDPKFISTITGLNFHWTTGVLWSLTIELIFYFSSAVSVYFLKIKNYLGVLFLTCSSITFHIFLKFFPLSQEILSIESYIWANYILYLPWFILGSTLYDLLFNDSKRKSAGIIFISSFIFLVAGNLSSEDFAGKNRSYALLIPLIIVFLMWQSVSGFRNKGVLGLGLLQNLGRVSYEYYLIHEILIIAGFSALGLLFSPTAVAKPVLYLLILIYTFIIYFISKLLYLSSVKLTDSYALKLKKKSI